MQRIKPGFVSHVSTFFNVALGVVLTLAWATGASAQPTNLAVTVRHAPVLNGSGLIEGSLQQLLGENTTLNGEFMLTGDLLVPGTPALRVNGNPTFDGTLISSGSSSPTGHQITLNGNCALRYLRTHTMPVALPTVTAPPQPAGTRTVTINQAGQSIGSPATIRDLTLDGNVGQVALPPGTYGTFTANGGSGFIFGVAGATQPAIYNLQNLNLNGNTRLDIIGPVILTVANGFTANGLVGATNHSSWLQLQIANGGFTLNGGCTVHGSVTAPAGTVIINGNSCLFGMVQSDRLTMNGGGCIKWGGSGAAGQPPVAGSQDLTTPEDTALAITLTGNDPEGAALTYTLLSPPTHGTLALQPSTLNQFIYIPNINFNGLDSFTFKVNDGQADSTAALITIAVTPVNDAPVALGQDLSTPEDTPLEIPLVGTDVDLDLLTYQIVTPPAKGCLNLIATNRFLYTPTPNGNGLDYFTFSVSDGRLCSTNTVHITIQPVDDAPVAGSQTVTTDEDTPVAVGLTALDVEGDGLAFTNLSQPAHGTLSGTPPDLIYTPDANYHGNDSFQFIASDWWMDSTPATISLIIKPVNDVPVANPQFIVTWEDSATNITLTGSDVDGDKLTFDVITQPLHGTLHGTPPQLIYSPAADFNGNDSFTFMAKDDQTNSTPTVLNLVINPVNDPPVAQAADLTTDEDVPLALRLTATDVDMDPLAYEIATPPTRGALTGTPPNLIYTPPTNFNGTDAFTFIVKDSQTNSLPATVTIAINPVNDAPRADDQSVTTEENTSLIITLAGSDEENDLLAFTVVNLPTHGTLNPQPSTSDQFMYTPNISFHGTDSFTFLCNDGDLDSPPATVAITVRQTNFAPVVEIVFPTNRTEFARGQAIHVNVAAADADGIVTRVRILVDGLLLAELPAPPFSIVWTNATIGDHLLTATATDNHETTSVSPNVFISVLEPESGDFLVDAGPDQIISLPNATSLAGTVEIQTPVAGAQTNITWSKLNGPGEVHFLDPAALTTGAQFSEPGTYGLKLQVAYADGTRSDALTVDVLPAPPDGLSATRSTKGADFWLTFLANLQPYMEPPYEGCDLYISAEVDTVVDVNELPDYKRRFQIPAGTSIRVPTYFPISFATSDSIQANAIHVTADHPVVVHGLNYLTYSTDGFLALPTTMLGTDYIVLAYQNSPSWSDPEYTDGGTEFAVVASEDDTRVIINPSASADSRIANVPYEIVLQQGETYRLINYDGPFADFTGTTIKSDKPVAVFGGHVCALIPPSLPAGDHLVEELPPVNTWGRHFVTMPLATRTKGDTFRFLAATNGTRLAINGEIVASLDRGQFYERIIAGPAEILASQPVLAAQYANGSDFDHSTGDPFMMLIPPFEQFGGDYILGTPQGVIFYDNPPREVYTNNYVNLTVRTNGVGRILLDNVPVPAGVFQSIGYGGYAGAQVPVSPGAHHLSAPVPFGVCLYGWAKYESYAFIGGFYSESAEADTKLELIQPTAFAASGHEKTVLAQVTNGRGRPIPNLEINFSVSGANVATGKATTTRLGRATFSYVGTHAGRDLITASLAEVEQSLTNTWIAGSDNTPPVVSVAGTPGQQFSRTLELAGTVTDNNLPAVGSLQVQWQLLDGPAGVQFENDTQAVTRAFCSQSGTYEFDFSAADSQFSSHARARVLVDDIPEIMGYGIPSLVPVGYPIDLWVDAWDDDDEVDRVEFYANDILIGICPPPEWGTGYGVNWTPSTSGSFPIRAVAFDFLGGSNVLDLGTIQVSYPPQVLLDSPDNGSALTVPTNVLVHATASDPDGTVVSLSVYVNGELLGASDGSNVAANWFPRWEGNYTLTAVATDDLGLSTYNNVAVTVTGDFPKVTLFPNYTNEFGQPFIRLPYGVPFDLQADVSMSGPYHITNVTFYAHPSSSSAYPIASFSSPPYQLSWAYTDASLFSISATAEADSGAIGEAGAWLRVYNLLSLAFVSPATDKPVTVGMPTPIRLSVEDPGHAIQTIDYYVNGELLVETTNSDPVVWLPPAPGKYELQARAHELISTWPPTADGATISVTANFAFLNDGISIVSPSDGNSLYIGSPAPICLAFEDPTGDFDHAEIFTNGVSLGQTTNACFEWTPEQTNDYSLTAVAYDHQSHASIPSEPVLVRVAQAPVPLISLRTVPEGQTNGWVGFPLLVAANVTLTTNIRVAKVEFFADGQLVDWLTNTPWLFSYVATNAGPHLLVARASTELGTAADSPPVSVGCTLQLEVMWEGVRSGEWVPVGTNKILGIRLADPGSIFDHVEFLANGTLLSSTRFCFTDWTPASGGDYTFRARAYDRFGNPYDTQDIILHSAVLHSPQVCILSPARLARFSAGQPVSFAIQAINAGSIVTNLSLFRNSQPEVSVNGDMLNYTWVNIPAGEHEFTAVATDDKGQTGEAKVRIVMDPPLDAGLLPPQNLDARALGCNAIQISWDTNVGVGTNTVVIEREEGTNAVWEIIQRVPSEEGTAVDCFLRAATVYRYRAYIQNADGNRSVDSEVMITRTRAYIPGFAVLDLSENLEDGGVFNPVSAAFHNAKSRMAAASTPNLDPGAATVDLSAVYALGLSDFGSVMLNDGSPTNYLWWSRSDYYQKLTDTNFFPSGLTRSGFPVGNYCARLEIAPQNVVTQYHAGYWQDGFVDLTPDVQALRTPASYPPPTTPYPTLNCVADMNANGAAVGVASWVWLICPDGQNSTVYFGPLRKATVWPGKNQPAVNYDALQALNNESEFVAINDQGDIVGNSAIFDPGQPDVQISHAMRSQLALLEANNKLTDLGTLGGRFSAALALNNSGIAVGYSTLSPEAAISDTRAVYWLPTETQPRPLPGYDPDRMTYAWGINDDNRIVGDAIDTNNIQWAALWEPNPAATNALGYDLVNLNALANSSDWLLRSARFINQQGLILGSGLNRTQYQIADGVPQIGFVNRPFLLIPDASLAVDYNRDGKIELNEKDDLHGQPYQFWINDDSDDGDVSTDPTAMSSVPGAQTGWPEFDGRDPNYADDKVNGACDLPDWFPVYLNISNLLTVLPSSQYQYRLVQAEGALNFLYTNLRPEMAGFYQTNVLVSGFGPVFSQPVATADVQQVTPDGVALSPEFLSMAATEGRGVLLFEARQSTTQPLRLEVWNSKRLVTALELPLRIGSVEDMYGWLNLRQVAGETRDRLSNIGPPNWPTFAPLGKAFVFVHGYNVNEMQSRGWASEMFKRLWWSGCDRRFYAVSWFGEDTQVGNVVTINFHTNVFHAFQTAPALASFLHDTLAGQDVTVMAHSLGNMVACLAIQNYNARPTRYFMVNCAVAMEAFDGGLDRQAFMTHPDWKDYPDRLYASEWYSLFPDNDGRHGLTWRNRFRDVPQWTQLYNFYSSGDEALENRHDNSDPWITDIISLRAQWPVGQWPVNWLPGRYAWVSQETLKGRITPGEVMKEYLAAGLTGNLGGLLDFVLALEGVRAGNIVGSQYGGWGFNPHWDISGHTEPIYFGGTPYYLYVPDRHLLPDETMAISIDDLQVDPFFLPFLDSRLTTAEGSEVAANPAMRTQLLAEAIPSRTFAAGANAFDENKFGNGKQFNMNVELKKRGWPTQRAGDSLKQARWLHSDVRDMSYLYTGTVFDKFVELEGEK